MKYIFLIISCYLYLLSNDIVDSNKDYNVFETKNIYLTPVQIYSYYKLNELKDLSNYSELENDFKNNLNPNYKPNLYDKIKMINLNYVINDNMSKIEKNVHLQNILDDKENIFINTKGDLISFNNKISSNDLFNYNELINSNILDKILLLNLNTNLLDKELLETKLIAINLKNKTFEFSKNEEIKLILVLNKAYESLLGFDKLEISKPQQFDKLIIYENYENFLDFVDKNINEN